jgi:hypothetical protein
VAGVINTNQGEILEKFLVSGGKNVIMEKSTTALNLQDNILNALLNRDGNYANKFR